MLSNDYEWKTVPYKKRRQKRPTTSFGLVSVTSSDLVDDVISVSEAETRLKQAVVELKRSEFYRDALNLIEPSLKGVSGFLCYGLGPPTASSTSMYQLALLNVIRGSLPCAVFDPAFNQFDLDFFKRLDIDVISENERCCRELESNTLVYMIHCDMWMYNNLLWANWSADNLRKMALLGNSFHSMLERVPSRRMRAQYEYIYLAGKLGLFQESLLPSWGQRDTLFNDTAVITFPPSNHHQFTRSKNPPHYDDVVVT